MDEELNNNGENNEELEDNIVVLNDENGEEVSFEFLDVIPYEGEDYVVLLPVEEDDEEEAGEVVILKIEDSEEEAEEETYVSVEDESILNAVFEMFKEKFKDEFNFVDDED